MLHLHPPTLTALPVQPVCDFAFLIITCTTYNHVMDTFAVWLEVLAAMSARIGFARALQLLQVLSVRGETEHKLDLPPVVVFRTEVPKDFTNKETSGEGEEEEDQPQFQHSEQETCSVSRWPEKDDDPGDEENCVFDYASSPNPSESKSDSASGSASEEDSWIGWFSDMTLWEQEQAQLGHNEPNPQPGWENTAVAPSQWGPPQPNNAVAPTQNAAEDPGSEDQ